MLKSRFYQCLRDKKTDLKGFLLKGLYESDFYKSVVKEHCPETIRLLQDKPFYRQRDKFFYPRPSNFSSAHLIHGSTFYETYGVQFGN